MIGDASKGLAAEKYRKPKVVADCSNIVYIFSKACPQTEAVANHLLKLTNPGIIMVPVYDRVVHPVWKQAKNQSIAMSKMPRIKAFQICKEICHRKQHIINESMDEAQRFALQKEVKKGR